MVEDVDLGKYQPSCMLAHELINKMAVIIGYCDLMDDQAPTDSNYRKRLGIIRGLANNMVVELRRHQCNIRKIAEEATKKPPTVQNPPSASKQSA